jgi:hypothetical protein
MKSYISAFGAIIAGVMMQGGLLAQGPKDTPQAPGPEPHNISSFWELRDEPGYGGAKEIDSSIKQAVLTPEYKKMIAEFQERARHPTPGTIVAGAARYCLPLGVPFMMGQSPPIDIIQGKNETLIFSEQHSSGRHIYTDGRQHPDPAVLELTSDGHSIGHWEGDTLIVDTTGFSGGAAFVPGGGGRGPTTHIVERFHLIDNGNKLNYQATWTDPTIYVEPHSYEMTYFRSAPTTFAMDEFCDAGDVKQGQSVIPPPQK